MELHNIYFCKLDEQSINWQLEQAVHIPQGIKLSITLLFQEFKVRKNIKLIFDFICLLLCIFIWCDFRSRLLLQKYDHKMKHGIFWKVWLLNIFWKDEYQNHSNLSDIRPTLSWFFCHIYQSDKRQVERLT